MAATRSSTKIWHAALLFVFFLASWHLWNGLFWKVLIVYGRTWCDLSGRASHTARLARRAPPQPAKQGGRLQSRPKARHARGQLRPPQLSRPVPLLGVIREISDEMLVQLYWQVEGEQRLSPITGILKQVPGTSRLQQGDKVHVHVLPMVGERLMLRLVVQPGCKGGLGFHRQSPSSKQAWSQVPDSEIKWSPKLERLDSVNWMDAEPLPHGLCGTAAQHLQGQVLHVDPAMATLRLFWEAPPGPGLETQNPELSPIAAQLSAEVLQAFFNLTAVPLCSDYLQEGQLLSVQLNEASSSPDMSVGLSPLQPIPPRPSPPCAGWAAPKIWQRLCSHTVPCRVTDAAEAAWRRTPVDTATEMEKKFGSPNHWKLHTTSSLATAAFAVSATKQDMVITGAMPRAERLSLLALLIAQHLSEAAPHERVLLLGPYANVRLQSLQRSKDELVREHLKKVRAQTLAGSLHEVLQLFTRKGRREDARSVSLVVVEGLPSDAKEQEALKQLLSLMPSQRRWGPTILWHREPAVGELKVMEAALTASPARLQMANALHGAHEQLKLVPESLAAAAQVIAQHLVRRRSIAIFTDRKQNLVTEMQKLVPDELLQHARLRIVSAADEWGKSDKGIFDIMIHVDPPPKPSEYFLRLASCRQLALVLMDVRKDHGEERLDNHWVEFANYAQDFVRGPDSWRLRHLCRHEHHGKTRLSQDFQKDFQASKKELVWTAGVAETDTGLIFDAGL